MNLTVDIRDTFLKFDDDVAKDILKHGAEILKESTEDVLRGDGRVKTGQLVNSLSTSVSSSSAYVSFKGKRSEGGSRSSNGRDRAIENNDIAFWLEYGNSTQGSHPFCDRAVSQAEHDICSYAEETISKAIRLE